MLHDIGATERNLTSTRLSFEFAGGILALKVLQSVNSRTELDGGGVDMDGDVDAEERVDKGREIAPQAQAESIVEAIMRHQDLCEKGKISALGQLLQLATILGTPILHATSNELRLTRR